jgi:hypothetical protein
MIKIEKNVLSLDEFLFFFFSYLLDNNHHQDRMISVSLVVIFGYLIVELVD